MTHPMSIATLYVSQKDGKDSYNGLYREPRNALDGPFFSIEAALERVREIRRADCLQPITVRILDKEYFMQKTVRIDAELCNITIEPYTATALIGGLRVDGFQKDRFGGVECYSADVSIAKEMSFSDFWMNGKRADLTRFPEEGTLDPVSVEKDEPELFTHSKWFIAKDEDFEHIKAFKNLSECIISFRHYWVDEHTPIEALEEDTHKIVFKYPSVFTLTPEIRAAALHYYVENVAEMFGKPNQWYLDKATAKLYYLPTEETTADALIGYLPTVEKLFEVCGEPTEPVRNVCIRGFEMAYTRGDAKWVVDDEPGQYFASSIQAVHNGRGSVEFKYAQYCRIENCHIHGTGIHALALWNGCRYISVENNHLEDLGAGGILMHGAPFGSSEEETTGNNRIVNNVIHKAGLRYSAACGVLLTHAFGNLISHNDIYDIYYTGISSGWVWGYEDSISQSNIIEYNHIYDLGKGKLSDMGGVYLLGKQQGTVVRGNLVHDIKAYDYGGRGIYTDEGSSYVTVENNVVYNTTHAPCHQHFGKQNTIRNNIFVALSDTPVKLGRSEHLTSWIVENNILVTGGKPYYSIVNLPAEDGKFTLDPIASRGNLLFDVSGSDTPLINLRWDKEDHHFSFADTLARFDMEVDSVVADPEFVDFKAHDFTLKATSPALALGFKPIDLEGVGATRK